ncbi:DUF4097 domain-containing protein [Actinoplanes sp. TBRC 11911]|nr:DUF4097 domain-containing protein [Actinoplanes sp. TBRC 11911]
MQNFATTAPITAILEIPAGRVELVAATSTSVEVRPADASKNRDVKMASQASVEFADGVLCIHTPGMHNQVFGPTGSLHVLVHLPAGSRVQAKTGAAELHTTGRLGELSFDGAYRAINIEEAAGVQLTAVDGDVEIGRLTGPAQISTAGGDIRVGEATHGKVLLSTQYGNITIGAATGVSAALDAGTGYGRVNNSLKNDGTPELDIHATTTHGDITARSL